MNLPENNGVEALISKSPVSRAALRELHLNESKMIGSYMSKSMNTKLSSPESRQRPHTIAVTPSADGISQLSSTAPASVFEMNAAIHPFPLDPELSEEGLSPITNTNKSSNKFIGLTSFDESKIPELPGSLRTELEGQMGLTFEENFMSQLATNAAASSSNPLKDFPNAHTMLISKEIEGAMCSDNESFADCQAFPEYVELENNLKAVPNATFQTISAQGNAAEMFEDEPMDVDISFTTLNEETAEATDPLSPTVQPEILKSDATIQILSPKHSSGNEINSTLEIEQPISESMQPIATLASLPECTAFTPVGVEPTEDVVTELHISTNSPTNVKTLNSVNLTMDINSSFSSAKSTTVSPGFPIKQTAILSHFPHSPSSGCKKEMIFLEKSEYAEQLNATRKTSVGSRKYTVATDNGEAPICSSSENNESASQNMAAPTGLNNIGDNIDRRTYTLDTELIADASNNAPHDDNVKRRTFDIIEAAVHALPTKNISPTREQVTQVGTEEETRRIFDLPPTCGIPDMSSTVSKDDVTENSNNVNPNDFEQPEVSTKRFTYDVPTIHEDPVVDITSTINEVSQVNTNVEKRLTFNVPPPCDTHAMSPPQSEGFEGSERESSDNLNAHAPDAGDKPQMSSKRYTFEIPSTHDDADGASHTFSSMDSAVPSQETSEAIDITMVSPTTSAPNSPLRNQQDNDRMDTSKAPIELNENEIESRVRSQPTSPSPISQTLISEKKFELQFFDSKSPPKSTIPKQEDSLFEFKLPPPVTALKRPPIRSTLAFTGESSHAVNDVLSAKELAKSGEKDEKDVFMEKFVPFENTSSAKIDNGPFEKFTSQQPTFDDDDFKDGTNLILNESDFDYLLTKGNSNIQVDRSSLLLKFDPLLGKPVLVNQAQQLQQQFNEQRRTLSLTDTIAEDEEQVYETNCSFVVEEPKKDRTDLNTVVSGEPAEIAELQSNLKTTATEEYAKMSVDVIKDMNIDHDCNKTFDNSNQTDAKHHFQMDGLEKKIQNEVLKTEDIGNKLKDAEQREEALIKRITEKDKTISKLNGVIEAYEKAIAELISEKEQLTQNYEKQMADVKADRDSNYHHLQSLEMTFSDLHIKYEKSKEMTLHLKQTEEALLAEKRQNLENLRLQEQRYEKMRNHAMQQLEIANKKLETMTKEHSSEITKLKALLKKEEISRASINEQLQQKSRENAELMQICDELINGQGS